MIIDGSRLVVTDNSGAKEVECIKHKGRYASIGDIITCSVKKGTRTGKVTPVSSPTGFWRSHQGCLERYLDLRAFHNRSLSNANAGTSGKGRDCGDQEGASQGRRQVRKASGT